MKRKLLAVTLCAFCLGFMSNASFAQNSNNQIDATGDIAFVAYLTNTQNGMAGFAFVLLDNCPVNTSIFFTDTEWTGSAWNSGEGDLIWTNTETQTITKGTVIKIAGLVGGNTFSGGSANKGSFTVDAGNGFGTASVASPAAADQIYAITGNRANAGTYLAFAGGTSGSPSLTNTGTPGLSNGTTAINTLTAGAYFSGSAVCNNIATCASTINSATWTTTTNALNNVTAFFAASPIPNTFNGTALPIELTAFDVQNTEGSKNNLTWTTASETNNKGFDIERSTDGTTFHSIGQVKGNNKPSSYQFVDNQPFATSYYRLRQIDNDGTETLSKVVSIALKGKGKGLKVYPTTTKDVLTVENNGAAVDVVTVFNQVGQLVFTAKQVNRVDMSALPSGMYLVQVQAGQEKVTKKVFKQ